MAEDKLVALLLHRLSVWRGCSAVIVILGAGASTAAGMPDYRGGQLSGMLTLAAEPRDSAALPSDVVTTESVPRAHAGLRKRLTKPVVADVRPLPSEPQEIFDSAVFADEPELFYSLAPRLYARLDRAMPTSAHAWLAALDSRGVLRRAYTQNVDGLEARAGVRAAQLICCHGTMTTFRCSQCGRRVRSDAPRLRPLLAAGVVAICRAAAGGRCAAPLRPDVVMYREPLPASFHTAAAADASPDAAPADAIVVLGTTLRVAPVSTLPSRLPATALRVLVNRERLAAPAACSFDLELLGEADLACEMLASELQAAPSAAVAAGVGHVHLRGSCARLSTDGNSLLCRLSPVAACTESVDLFK